MLQRGDQMPHVVLHQLDGAEVRYADIWQHRNLLLVMLPEDDAGFDQFAGQVRDRAADIAAAETVLVITREDVAGAPSPGLLIADRWGEIYFVVWARRAQELPPMEQLLDWLRYVQHECPECQGEVK
jgi:hypothetical protein